MTTVWPSQLPKVPRGAGQAAQTDALKRALAVLEQRTDFLKENATTPDGNQNTDFVATFNYALNGTTP